MSICVGFMVNKPYFEKFIDTCYQLVNNGKYKGDICLLIGDDLKDDSLLNHNIITDNNVIIKYFPNIQFPSEFTAINNTINSDGRNLTKKFQWHKLHFFNTFFKKWNYVFYIDCGMSILNDISPILKEIKPNKLLAHSDAYPTYVWKLHNQFDTAKELYNEMSKKYNMNIDYFQTGIMLFDTSIITDDTFNDLYKLALLYPISRTNEQGIIALYFTNINPLFEQIKIKNDDTYFYDYTNRDKSSRYIMVKVL